MYTWVIEPKTESIIAELKDQIGAERLKEKIATMVDNYFSERAQEELVVLSPDGTPYAIFKPLLNLADNDDATPSELAS